MAVIAVCMPVSLCQVDQNIIEETKKGSALIK